MAAATLAFAGSTIFRGASGGGATGRRRPVMAVAAVADAPTAASLYEVLRVKETATPGEIKAAYRALAKRFHPDVTGGAAGSEFVEIHRAYATLSDPAGRASYDRSIGRLGMGMRIGLSGEGRMGSRRWETDQCW